MIDIANEKTDFNGSVVLVKPISIGTLFPAFKVQDERYTVMLRGLVDGKPVESNDIEEWIPTTESLYVTGIYKKAC